MSRMWQEVEVHRGHHGVNRDPEDTTIGIPTWTTSLAAADVYAREPSIEGATAHAPTVSTRKFYTEYPLILPDTVDVATDLGRDLGLAPDELKYITDKFGAKAKAWELAADETVQQMIADRGADMIVHPEEFTGKPRFGDPEEQIQTFRPLGAEMGDTSMEDVSDYGIGQSYIAQQGVDVAGAGKIPIGKVFNELWELWHGSPHKFDQFDASKIGTGEGAQAYGHGLYLAEAEEVAGTYSPSRYLEQDQQKLVSMMSKAQDAQDYDAATIYEAALLHQTPAQMRARYLGTGEYDRASEAAMAKAIDKVEASFPTEGGFTYQVSLPSEMKDQMLDWDAPLKHQPEVLKEVMREVLKDHGYLGPTDNGPVQLTRAMRAYRIERGGFTDTDTGESIYTMLSNSMRGEIDTAYVNAAKSMQGDDFSTIYAALVAAYPDAPKMQLRALAADPESAGDADRMASAALRSLGLPGIKYKDAMSRGGGKGTSNVVVFDDKAITIKDRNGKKLKGAALAAALTAMGMGKPDESEANGD